MREREELRGREREELIESSKQGGIPVPAGWVYR